MTDLEKDLCAILTVSWVGEYTWDTICAYCNKEVDYDLEGFPQCDHKETCLMTKYSELLKKYEEI